MTPRELEKYLRKALIRPVEPACPAKKFRYFITMPVMDELEELAGRLPPEQLENYLAELMSQSRTESADLPLFMMEENQHTEDFR